MTSETSTAITAAAGIGTLYKTHEVATMLRVGQRTVQERIRTGALPAQRYGKLLRVRHEDLVAFGQGIQARTPPAPPRAGASVVGHVSCAKGPWVRGRGHVRAEPKRREERLTGEGGPA
jgi:excisionase family DNA binding protein